VRYVKGFINGLLLILAAHMFTCSTMKAQVPHIPDVHFADSLPGQYFAFTTCDASNQATIVVRRNLNLAGLTQALTHEGTHAKQMDSYEGGCLAAQAKYQTDPEFRFNMELEAYCTQLRNVPGFQLQLPDFANFMWANYGKHLTQEQTQLRVIEACAPRLSLK
jgi:hypothetical protein